MICPRLMKPINVSYVMFVQTWIALVTAIDLKFRERISLRDWRSLEVRFVIATNLSLFLNMDIPEELNRSLEFHYCVTCGGFSSLPLESNLIFHKGTRLNQDRFHSDSVFHRPLANWDSESRTSKATLLNLDFFFVFHIAPDWFYWKLNLQNMMNSMGI